MSSTKTAIERLRALLDERGVKHVGHGGMTRWTNESGCVCRAYTRPNPSSVDVAIMDASPEQAIAATLGPGTCRNVHEPPKDATFWPAPHFKCSECGEVHVSMQYVYFCPNCGRRVEVDG